MRVQRFFMIDSSQVSSILRERLSLPVDNVTITRLQGDASNRTYYRLSCSPHKTLVLMALAEPEAFKTSEEMVTGRHEVTELPFLNIQRHLLSNSIPVPEIYHFDKAKGWLILEDLGDFTFVQRVMEEREEIRLGYYQDAIDILVTMQREASHPSSTCIAFKRAFDVPLLIWEFEHFLEFELEKRKGITFHAKQSKEIRACFLEISKVLASEPRVFTHRDYHSRNLMLQPNGTRERLRVIDFQDALMGPPQYDLASLLRDAYIVLTDKTVDALVDYYLDGVKQEKGMRPNPDRFRELFDMMSLQRNLKAVGRFAYIDLVKKNNRYLEYIPQTIGRVKNILGKNPKLFSLRHLLEDYLAEFPSS